MRLDWDDKAKWEERSKQIRRAGQLAELVHNLAAYSADDFVNSSEQWFWSEYEDLKKKDPSSAVARLKDVFDNTIMQTQQVDASGEGMRNR